MRNFPVFTIDTGLLFPETHELKAAIEKRFAITIEPLVPEQTVDQQAAELGPELWKTKPDLC
ncbi:MAG: phosphoadenosine phosphosulfate reductase family protein, partial [Chthoniobacterales bacterium]|nr:phosphoadenosine phosphosulfate reductase family protein [Chthoniobacterales bacterium]